MRVEPKMTRTTKHLAVLFADVCGSTQLYATLGDEQARSAVNAALQMAAALLPGYSGWTVKTLGDEVMCAFEDPNDAVEAACAMQSRQRHTSRTAIVSAPVYKVKYQFAAAGDAGFPVLPR